MTFRPLKSAFSWPLVLGALTISVAQAEPPAAQPPAPAIPSTPSAPSTGRRIEWSSSPALDLATNMNQLNMRRDGLRQLEEDLFKPFQTFAPKGSLDPVPDEPIVAPTARSAAPNKRVKDALDRKRNWGLLSPEDFLGGPTAEEIFDLPEFDENGLEKKKSTALDRFYERLNRKSGELGFDDPSDPDRRKKHKRMEDGSNSEESELLKGLNASENEVKKLLSPEKNALTPLFKPLLKDSFGSELRPPAPEEVEVHRQRMNDYGNLLGVDPLLTPASPSSLSPIQPMSWRDIYTPSRPAAPIAPAGSRPVTVSPLTGLPGLAAPAAPAPALPAREVPRALPKALDLPQRKF